MDGFEDKVVLITGAGRGSGRETALAFAACGATVAANDINPLALDETVQQVMQAGGAARALVFDTAKRMPVEGMVAQVLEQFGRIDILVNHASVQPDASVLEMDEWEFHRTLDVNLGGPFFTTQLAGRVMQQHGGGSIVNLLSSGDPQRFRKGYAAYAASLAGLIGLTRAAAAELSADHIRVNAVCHGLVLPGINLATQQDLPGLHAWAEAHRSVMQGDYSLLASAVLYLCSNEAEALTGQIIAIDSSR